MLESEQMAIVAKFLDNPHDEAVLGAYADWLEEQPKYEYHAQVFREKRGFIYSKDILRLHMDLHAEGSKLIPGVFTKLHLSLYNFLAEAEQIFKSQPIREVVLTDRAPIGFYTDSILYVGFRLDGTGATDEEVEEYDASSDLSGRFSPYEDREYYLPKELFEPLKKLQIREIGTNSVPFDLMITATKALSHVACNYGRALAGLPPLA